MDSRGLRHLESGPGSGRRPRWYVERLDYQNLIESPLTLGEPPRPGTSPPLPPLQLTPEIVYEVTLWRMDGNEQRIVGSQS